MDSWWAVDQFASLAGPAWRKGHVSDARVLLWTRSENRWWRRAALVCTVCLNRKSLGGQGDTRRTLVVCERLAGDRDDMVAKALSWALRELAKREPEPVIEFVDQNEAVLPKRVIREVRRKIETGRKGG